jgi:large subunit ribosomal protein L7/L12
MADEDVKKQEKQAEKEAEAEEKMEKEASKEETAASPDETAQPEAAVEEAAGVEEETPAEVEAVNTDNETAKEAAEVSAKSEERPKKEKPKPEPTGKFKDLIKDIEGLTTVELAELVKALEERFGVSAAAPISMAGAPAGGAASGAEAAEEKSNYTVVLADSGAQKIAVIKALREINQELGLKEAKDIADAPPKEILKDAPKEKAEEAKKKLEAAGAKVELK